MLTKVKTTRELIDSLLLKHLSSLKYDLHFSELDGTFTLSIKGFTDEWSKKQIEKDPDLGFMEYEWSFDYKKFEEFIVILRQNDLDLYEIKYQDGDHIKLTIGDK